MIIVQNAFAIVEAINSVALSHEADCKCITCKAAKGDKQALAEILLEVSKKVDD